MTERRRVVRVFEREFQTVWRSRATWLLGTGFFVLTVGIGLFSGTAGYVPLALALLTPLELLVPALAAALGYRAILADRERREIAVLRTFPVSKAAYVGGVYAGRLVAVLGIVVATLAVTGVVVPVFGASPAGLAQTSGLDSPVYYLRFVVVTALLAAVVLAVLVFVSAVARHARRGLTVALGTVVVLTFGFDFAIVIGLATGVLSGQALPLAVALSPLSAYRGLVVAFVVDPVVTSPVPAANTALSVASLVVWTTFSFLGALWQVWAPTSFQRPSAE